MLEINDENDESLRTIDQEPEQGLPFFPISLLFYNEILFLVHMKELFKEMAECKNEIRNLTSLVRHFRFLFNYFILFFRFYQKNVIPNVDQFQQVF